MYENQYVYVDFHAHMLETGRQTKWIRIHESKIPELQKKHKGWDQFVTVQKYSAPVHTPGEMQYVPIYFDLDSKDNLEKARQDAIRIINHFQAIGADDDVIRIYFSGSKGFHITVEPSVFGIEPHPELSYKIKEACNDTALQLGLSTFDSTVYSIRRMWRLPDSVHGGSGLNCVELTHGEIVQSVDVIKKIAEEPRHESFGGIPPHQPADKDWWKHYQRQYEDMKDAERLQPKGDIIVAADGSDPACIQDVMENGMRKIGTRHRAVLQLVTYFWKKGLSREETLEKVTEWSLSDDTMTSSGKIPSINEKKSGVRSVVYSIYAKEKEDWKFACGSIRALGGDAGDCIACEWDDCKFVNQAEQKPDKRIDVPLSKAHEAQYRGIPSSSEVYVVGVSRAPFLVPRRVGFKCTPDLERANSVCQFCPYSESIDAEGKSGGEKTISTSDSTMIEFCKVNKKTHAGIILKALSVPHNCKRAIPYSSKETAAINLVEAQADVVANVEITSEDDINDAHRVYTFFHIGNDVLPNKRYVLDYITHASPEDQLAVHLSDNARPIESDFEKFTMTPEIYDQLKVFQPNGTVKEKFEEIHKCLEANVHRMWDRRELATGVDLVFHSALSFYFQGVPINRGWLEMLVFGDSGQGKSEIPKKLIKFYARGERVSCEQASEAGLVGGCDTGSNIVRWGAIPRNDKGFLLLDEVHSLPEHVLGNLSDIRDEGVAQIHKFSKGKAMSRNRKIFTSNPKHRNTSMRSSPFGITVLTGIFNAPEDVRRLDLAIAITNRDVPKEVLNQKVVPSVEYLYDQPSCSLLLDWIWSRRMDQIKISEDVEHYILDKSVEMCDDFDDAIPVVHAAVQKQSIARLAVACAGRMASMDESGDCLIVLKEHVDFVVNFLTTHYKSKAMGYFEYSIEARKYTTWEKTKDRDEFEECCHELKTTVLRLKSLLTAISQHVIFRPIEIEMEWEGSTRDDIKRVMSLFNRYKLVKPVDSKGHFSRSEKFGDVYEALKSLNDDDMPQLSDNDIGDYLGKF
jgi:DNA primase large subunit